MTSPLTKTFQTKHWSLCTPKLRVHHWANYTCSHYVDIYSFITCASITLKYSSCHTLHLLGYRINCFLLHCWGSSSELSPQSLSPSHNQERDTQWPLEHEKSLDEHVACSEKQNTTQIFRVLQCLNLSQKQWHIKNQWHNITVKQ